MDSAVKEKEMEGTAPIRPRTVEDVFQREGNGRNDFKARRAGLIKALSSDVEKFFELCDPEKDHLCLYGLPNETWEVKLAMEEVPPKLPEPTLGINFVRDGMKKRDWLSMIAVHSDSWLLAVAFCYAARFGFGEDARKKLFQMINELPTIFEVVTQSAKEVQGEEDDEVDGILCGACGSKYDPDEFRICCDVCDIWFHGKCVKITPAKAESLKEFKCPGCSGKIAQA